MLKTVSSITNAIGALNYKGTWDANANSPALTSSVGTKGDYYVVGTAGSTNLNGISNWGIGDWAAFNGSVWQRVEGGANLNGVNLSVSGTSTLSGLTASTPLALNASKEIVSDSTIAKTNIAQTFNGSQTFETASDNQVNIDATGSGAYSTINFKQGGVNKTNLFQEHGTTRFYIINSSGGVYLASGGIAWIAASDERKKDIIEPITNATSKVNQLRAVIGKYKTDAEGTRRSFLIAQDVQAVLPEAVDATNPDVLGLSYGEIIPLLVAAIKEQTQEIEQLKLAIKGN